MKISKLFHWLYAFLMFLPVIFVLPTLFYFGFNKNAVVEEKTEVIPLSYSTNEVSSQNDLVVGNVYTFTFHASPSISEYGPFYWEEYFFVSGTGSTGTNYGPRYDCFYFLAYDVLDIYTETEIIHAVSDGFTFDFVYSGNPSSGWPVSMISACPREHPNGEGFNTLIYPGIVGDVEHEFNRIFEMPIFSWATDNFISVPFSYLTSLFGIAANSVINKYLTYWLSISVIWLCFDVIMYVPLLVHRWLDKGIVE